MDRVPQTCRRKRAIAEEVTSCRTLDGGAELVCRLNLWRKRRFIYTEVDGVLAAEVYECTNTNVQVFPADTGLWASRRQVDSISA
jgi:hypothetical protein